MARAQKHDRLLACRFFLAILDGGSRSLNHFRGGSSGDVAGFQRITSPELTIGPKVLYREGQYHYAKQYPGLPSFNTVTLFRGVARGDNTFYQWAVETAEGGDTREDLALYQYHRDALVPLQLADAVRAGDNTRAIDVLNATAGRILKLLKGQPSRYRPGQDFDANASEVSVMELDLDYTRYEEEHRVPR